MELGEVLTEVGRVSLFMLPLAFSAAAFLDAARWPSWVWALAGRRRILWLSIIAVGILSVVGGVVISAAYFLIVHRDLRAIERGDIDRHT